MAAAAGYCRLLGLLYFSAVPQLPAAVPLSVPPASLPGGVRPVREPSRSAVKGGGHKGPREPLRDYVAGPRPHPPHHLANTLSNCGGGVVRNVRGRSPAFMGGQSSGRLPPPVLSERPRTALNETETETDGGAGLVSIFAVGGGVMALVRKGSRRIVVDGRAYRWRLRGRPTYSEGLAWSPCTFVVEHADNPGTTLVVTTNQPHPSNWIGREAEPVLPSGVAAAVRLALRAGWTPTAPGSAFRLDQSAGFTPGY